MLRVLSFACFILGGMWLAWGQVVTLSPAQPQADDDVTIVFDATQGNQALKDHRGAVYAHTAIITGTPQKPSGWRYVQGKWGRADPRVRMTYLGDNRYELRFNLRRFYGLPPGEDVLQLAFVFRDRSGARVAKTANGEDIYVPKLPTRQVTGEQALDLSQARSMGSLSDVNLVDSTGLTFSDGRQHLTVRAHGLGCLALVYGPQGANEGPSSSRSVVASPTVLRYERSADGSYRVEVDARHELRVSTDPLRWQLWRGAQLLLDDEAGFVHDAAGRATGLRLRLQPQEQLYGLGSRALPMNRRGYRLDAYHAASYGYQAGAQDSYLSLPYVQSSAQYGLMLDSYRRGYFDLGAAESDILEVGVEEVGLTCYVLTGPPDSLAQRLTRLTGRQPLPPRWALGYLQSRFGYRSQREALETALLTREAGLGLDAVMLDAYWFGGPSRMGDLDWATGQWPDPAGLMQRLDRLGIGTVPIIEPYFLRGTRGYDTLAALNYLAQRVDGRPYVVEDFWAGPAGLIDIFRPGARDWLWQQVQPLIEQGAAGVWSDLIEPEKHPVGMRHLPGLASTVHNAYPLVWNQGLYERFRQQYPARRWFNLTRSGHLGMQRYATFPWTGDVSRSWAGLRAQPGAMLGAGLCGVGYLHSDLGGFTGASEDEELYRRWIQLGVFSPLMRVHGNVEGFEPEPVYHPSATREQVARAIELRYRLLPYLYTRCWENHRYGWPLARPLFFHYPADSNAYQVSSAYLWGRDLLVVPVLEPGLAKVDVYLPPGIWYDFFTGEKYRGGYTYRMPVVAAHLPVFVRGGSLLPLGAAPDNLSAWSADSLHWTLSLGEEGEKLAGTIYLDDGASFGSYANGQYRRMTWTGSWDKRTIELTLEAEGEGYPDEPSRYLHHLSIHGLAAPPRRIKIGRQRLRAGDWQWQSGVLSFSFRHPPSFLAVQVVRSR